MKNLKCITKLKTFLKKAFIFVHLYIRYIVSFVWIFGPFFNNSSKYNTHPRNTLSSKPFDSKEICIFSIFWEGKEMELSRNLFLTTGKRKISRDFMKRFLIKSELARNKRVLYSTF